MQVAHRFELEDPAPPSRAYRQLSRLHPPFWHLHSINGIFGISYMYLVVEKTYKHELGSRRRNERLRATYAEAILICVRHDKSGGGEGHDVRLPHFMQSPYQDPEQVRVYAALHSLDVEHHEHVSPDQSVWPMHALQSLLEQVALACTKHRASMPTQKRSRM